MCLWGFGVVGNKQNRGIFFHYTALRAVSKLALAVPKAESFLLFYFFFVFLLFVLSCVWI